MIRINRRKGCGLKGNGGMREEANEEGKSMRREKGKGVASEGGWVGDAQREGRHDETSRAGEEVVNGGYRFQSRVGDANWVLR